LRRCTDSRTPTQLVERKIALHHVRRADIAVDEAVEQMAEIESVDPPGGVRIAHDVDRAAVVNRQRHPPDEQDLQERHENGGQPAQGPEPSAGSVLARARSSESHGKGCQRMPALGLFDRTAIRMPFQAILTTPRT
jgi:hypothetical protein